MKTREIQFVKIGRLVKNTGEQIPGLKTNPRQWTQADINRLADSIRETPELFEGRPLLAAPIPGDEKGRLVVLGGNLRLDAGKHLGEKELPVIVYEDTPADVLNAIVIKDNGSFGSWDYDTLANEWSDLPLGDWGVPAWEAGAPAAAGDGLPAELDGLDLTPDTLPEMPSVGDEGNKRVIIAYTDDQEAAVAAWLGVEKIDRIIYDFNEVQH